MLVLQFERAGTSADNYIVRGIVFKQVEVDYYQIHDIAEGVDLESILEHMMILHPSISHIRKSDGTLDHGDCLSLEEVAQLEWPELSLHYNQ